VSAFLKKRSQGRLLATALIQSQHGCPPFKWSSSQYIAAVNDHIIMWLLAQVLARSSPTDKFDLVKLLKKQGEIVAVTGQALFRM